MTGEYLTAAKSSNEQSMLIAATMMGPIYTLGRVQVFIDPTLKRPPTAPSKNTGSLDELKGSLSVFNVVLSPEDEARIRQLSKQQNGWHYLIASPERITYQ